MRRQGWPGGRIPGPFGIIGYPPGMAFLSIHTMEGDPDDLLARKRQHMDPVTERFADADCVLYRTD